MTDTRRRAVGVNRIGMEARLSIHVLNLCLAAVANRDGAIAEAKGLLLDDVAKMLNETVERAVEEVMGLTEKVITDFASSAKLSSPQQEKRE